MDTVSTKDLCKDIAQQLGFKSSGVYKVLSALRKNVKGALEGGKEVRLGFVSIRLQETKECTRRNPKTGEPVFCPSYMAVKAHVAPSTRRAVKEKSLPKKKKASK